MAGRSALITLAGTVYRVARDPQTGAPLWRRERTPATADDLIPFRETVSFGYLGLGGSDPSLRGCYDYGLDIDTETWDVLGPGPRRQLVGLSLSQPVVAIASVRAASQPNIFANPTGSDDGTSWTAPANIATSNDAYATANVSSGAPSSYLRATNWGISGITSLMGFEVQVEGKVTNTVFPARLSLQLLNGSGTPVGAVKNITLTPTEGYIAAGGPTDMWETSLTPADLNSASFGVRMYASALTSSQWASTVISAGSWSNPNNALGAPDSTYSTHSGGFAQTTTELLLGYSFPSSAETGVFSITVYYNAIGFDLTVRLYEGSTTKFTGTIYVNGIGSYTFNTGNLSFTNLSNLRVGITFTDKSGSSNIARIDAVRVDVTPNATVAIDHVRMIVYDGTSSRKLYAGGGAQLAKVDIKTMTVDDVQTFTHGESGYSPTITDIVTVKDGADPFNLSVSGIGGPVMAIAFGHTAQIQQVNVVNPTGADTYGTLSNNKAFASALAVTMSPDNTQVLLWRTERVGTSTAFSQLKTVAIGSATVDITNSTNWSPTPGYQMGDVAESITSMVEYARGLVVGKPSGVYTVDDRFSPFMLFGTRAYRHEDNSRRLFAWGTRLVIPTSHDLAAIPGGQDPFIGLSRLVANRSPVRGYPTAVASHGRYLYTAFYDGADSWICRGRLSQGEVPWPVVWHSLVRVQGYKVRALHVTDDGAGGPVRLFWSAPGAGGNHDVAYMAIDPRASTPTYQSGGVMYSQRFGVMTKRTVLRRVYAYGQGCTASSYWTIEVAFDGGTWQPVGTVQTTGPVSFNLNPPPTGTVGQLRLTCTVGTPTDRPLLLGTTSEQAGPGGIVVEGFRQADEVDRFEIQVRVGREGLAGPMARQTRTPAAVLADLRAIQGQPVSLVAEDLFGDRNPRTVVVQAVAEQPTGQTGDLPAERVIALRGYVIG